MVWLAPAIMATAALMQSLVNRRQEKANIKDQTSANLALSQNEFSQNKQMWELQNFYNSPESQMMRLKGAGLNPNLVYGSGNAAGNQSGAPPTYRGRETQVGVSPIQIPEIISQYQDFQMRQAQIDNVKAQTENTVERTVTEPIARELKRILGDKGTFETERGRELLPYQLSASEAVAKRAQVGIGIDTQKLENLRQDEKLKILVGQQKSQQMGTESIRQGLLSAETEKKQAELLFQRYKNEWIKQGVTTSDNLMVRMFVKMLNETGMSISDGWEKLKETGGKIFRPENWMGKDFLRKK